MFSQDFYWYNILLILNAIGILLWLTAFLSITFSTKITWQNKWPLLFAGFSLMLLSAGINYVLGKAAYLMFSFVATSSYFTAALMYINKSNKE